MNGLGIFWGHKKEGGARIQDRGTISEIEVRPI
jgi:hypothetical protein